VLVGCLWFDVPLYISMDVRVRFGRNNIAPKPIHKFQEEFVRFSLVLNLPILPAFILFPESIELGHRAVTHTWFSRLFPIQISQCADRAVNANVRFFTAALLALESDVSQERVRSNAMTLKQKHKRIIGYMPTVTTSQA